MAIIHSFDYHVAKMEFQMRGRARENAAFRENQNTIGLTDCIAH